MGLLLFPIAVRYFVRAKASYPSKMVEITPFFLLIFFPGRIGLNPQDLEDITKMVLFWMI